MVICLELGADLHMAQLMPLPLTVSCFSKIQIGFTFLVPGHPGSPGQRSVKRVCVCVDGVCIYSCFVFNFLDYFFWCHALDAAGTSQLFKSTCCHIVSYRIVKDECSVCYITISVWRQL